jgi:DNA mismatch repair ATPase MutL
MGERIRVLKDEEISRLAASIFIPKFSEVYLGLMQNCSTLPQRVSFNGPGIDGNASSIEGYIDIDGGKITVIDNGQGITPESLTVISNSKGSAIGRPCSPGQGVSRQQPKNPSSQEMVTVFSPL